MSLSISQLYNYPIDPEHRDKLMILLNKFFRSIYNKDEICALLSKKLSDEDYLQMFKKRYKERIQIKNVAAVNYERGKKRLSQLKKLFRTLLLETPLNKILSSGGLYFDIGSGDGIITTTIGLGLGFPEERIVASDIKPIDDQNKCTFLLCDGEKLNVDDNTVSLLSLFQTFHHIKNPHKILSEIRRICRPYSILVVREQDVGAYDPQKKINRYLFGLEHEIYDTIIGDMSTEEFLKTYYADYYGINSLINLFNRYDFKLIGTDYNKKYNPTNNYYAVFRLIKAS
jgi:ubiquinone/menaquinone biosynthesis C-methylase UbiE